MIMIMIVMVSVVAMVMVINVIVFSSIRIILNIFGSLDTEKCMFALVMHKAWLLWP